MDLAVSTESAIAAQQLSVTQAWAALAGKVRREGLPAPVLALARDRLVDVVATAIAARTLGVPETVRRFIGSAGGRATVIGSAQQASAIDAAFLNAVLVNGCTHDDFIAKSHAGAVTVPAALAVAQEEGGASGVDLLAAIVLGYEVTARAYLGGPGMLPRFRATGVAGSFGAAMASAYLMRLSEPQIAHALGLAAMFSSGFGEGFLTGSMDVKLNVGWASRSGVSAAQLARCGATSAPRVMEGPSGFYEAFANGAAHAALATQGLGERFLIEDSVYKERPVCIFVQTPVELACRLRDTHGLVGQRIEQVRIRAPLATLTNPGYRNVAPFLTPLQARISVRYTVAAALLGRPVEAYDCYEAVADPEVLALEGRIELLEPGDDATVWIEVRTAAGTVQASGVEMDHLLPSPDKTVAKYRRLTSGLPAGTKDKLLDTLLAIERLDDIAPLAALLRAV